MPLTLSDLDRRAVLYLRDQYLQDAHKLDVAKVAEDLGLPDQRAAKQVLDRMASIDVVECQVSDISGFQRVQWVVMPKVAEVALALETPPDRVEEFLSMLNKKEATYRWVLIAFGMAAGITFLTGLLTLINQGFELAKNIRGIG